MQKIIIHNYMIVLFLILSLLLLKKAHYLFYNYIQIKFIYNLFVTHKWYNS